MFAYRNGKLEKDWMIQKRIRGKTIDDDELGVLIWGESRLRFQKTDTWIEYFTKNNGEIEYIAPVR